MNFCTWLEYNEKSWRKIGWYNLLNGTKRFIGQEDMEAVIAKLEEEAAIACSAYDKEVNERDRLNDEISNLTADKKAMLAQLNFAGSVRRHFY